MKSNAKLKRTRKIRLRERFLTCISSNICQTLHNVLLTRTNTHLTRTMNICLFERGMLKGGNNFLVVAIICIRKRLFPESIATPTKRFFLSLHAVLALSFSLLGPFLKSNQCSSAHSIIVLRVASRKQYTLSRSRMLNSLSPKSWYHVAMEIFHKQETVKEDSAMRTRCVPALR